MKQNRSAFSKKQRGADKLIEQESDIARKKNTKLSQTSNRKSSQSDNTEKLQKVLANLGNGSRREIEAMIVAGKISVDGKIATLGDRVDVNASPKIRINGHLVQLRSKEKEVCRVLNLKVKFVLEMIHKGEQQCLSDYLA